MTGADHENGDGHPDDLAITNGIEAIDPFEPVDSVARHALHDPAPLALHPSTLALHADADHVFGADVAPPLHLSTTFLYPSDPDTMVTARERTDPGERAVPSSLVYSRISAPNLSRLESILSALLHAPSLTYTSGLAAVHALYTVIHPPRVFLTGGYHGVHGVVQLLHRVSAGGSFVSQPLSSAEELCGPGDVIHVETPLNPTGEVRPIAKYADLAHRRGAYVVVDATLGPPPLQDPFKHGADAVIHSGTKYFGGHSDMLLGVVATVKKDWVQQLTKDRVFLGAVPGNMEAWLGIRSLRTLGLRVERQARSAEKLVGWMSTILEGGAPRGLAVDPKDLEAAKERPAEGEWIDGQMSNGLHSPVFALVCREERLGGVESLIEWRAMSDTTVDTRLLRLSVGVEEPIDLMADLIQGCKAVMLEVESGAAGQ